MFTQYRKRSWVGRMYRRTYEMLDREPSYIGVDSCHIRKVVGCFFIPTWFITAQPFGFPIPPIGIFMILVILYTFITMTTVMLITLGTTLAIVMVVVGTVKLFPKIVGITEEFFAPVLRKLGVFRLVRWVARRIEGRDVWIFPLWFVLFLVGMVSMQIVAYSLGIEVLFNLILIVESVFFMILMAVLFAAGAVFVDDRTDIGYKVEKTFSGGKKIVAAPYKVTLGSRGIIRQWYRDVKKKVCRPVIWID